MSNLFLSCYLLPLGLTHYLYNGVIFVLVKNILKGIKKHQHINRIRIKRKNGPEKGAVYAKYWSCRAERSTSTLLPLTVVGSLGGG